MLQETGKRKRSVARAFAKKGSGKILINKKPLDIVTPEMVRLMIKEPLIIGGAAANNLDITVNVSGGGVFGQASAARQAIAKLLVDHDKNLKEKFLNYDRSLLIADSRRTEPHKPSRSSAGPRRHKQRSKR
ncbi:MAG: 30S ribosomal protein S9 [Candidatus Aenigmatarchaeota archaeon]